MVTTTPRIGEGPGFDFQANKYCISNLHWIHGNTIEVEDFEFVPVLQYSC